MPDKQIGLLRFELIPLREVPDETLIWRRPDFLAVRYELHCSAGLAATVIVSGMGDLRHALGETAEGRWRFEVFPFASDRVVIKGAEDHAEIGAYERHAPFEIRLTSGPSYGLTSRGLDAEDGRPVFSYEQVESFPRWRAEVKLDAGAIEIAELPLLVVSACCIRVFR